MIEIEKCGILLAPSVRLAQSLMPGWFARWSSAHVISLGQNFEKAQSSNFRYQKILLHTLLLILMEI